MIMMIVQAIALVLSTAVIVVTLLPLLRSHVWWIRAWDFPRLQIVLVGAVALFAVPALPEPASFIVLAAVLACIAYQAWRIWPYTPFAKTEMTFAPDGPDRITLMASNVLMENSQFGRIVEVVDAVDPDALLLMEIDARWLEALEPMLQRYPTVVRVPLDNHYGMVFATRLKTRKARMVQLTVEETPTLFAELETRDGHAFHFIGLHPTPPLPGDDTGERDAQILYAARFARKSGIPIVAMGDFNDVAWSDNAATFRQAGGYLDARKGRGLFSSFDAQRWWMRFPLDHFYVTHDVAVVGLERGAAIGSDHFPMIAKLRIAPGLADGLNRPPPRLDPEEEKRVDEIVAEYGRRLPSDPLA